MEDTQLINLVRQAQTGDREAFGELVQAFEPTVFGIIMRRLRNRAEASEVAQEVFLRALRKLDQLREPERFPGWLKRIAVRMSINRAVRRPKETMQAPDVLGDGSAPGNRERQEEGVEARIVEAFANKSTGGDHNAGLAVGGALETIEGLRKLLAAHAAAQGNEMIDLLV